MIDLTTKQFIILICVGIYTFAAAVWDLRVKKIPNSLTVPMFVLGWIYQAGWNGWPGLSDAFLAFLLGFGTLFVLWMIGGGGGGDVKLMGALSIWLGFQLTLWVLILSTLIAITISMAATLYSFFTKGVRGAHQLALSSGSLEKKKGKWTVIGDSIVKKQKRRIVAYAIPVALATWMVMLWKIDLLR